MSITTEDVSFDPPPTHRENELARVLELIDAEWRSDPASVACFDLRIIEDARKALAEHTRAKERETRYMRRPFRRR
jgi:hypothetical protein